MTKNDLVTIRPMKESDKNFIYSTFLIGLFYGNSWFNLIDKDTFMHNYHKILDILLSNPDTVVKTACLKDDADTIVGYSIEKVDKSVVHWCFVKKAWRGIGIANSLVSHEAKITTHMTNAGIAICSKKKIAFNPFVL